MTKNDVLVAESKPLVVRKGQVIVEYIDDKVTMLTVTRVDPGCTRNNVHVSVRNVHNTKDKRQYCYDALLPILIVASNGRSLSTLVAKWFGTDETSQPIVLKTIRTTVISPEILRGMAESGAWKGKRND